MVVMDKNHRCQKLGGQGGPAGLNIINMCTFCLNHIQISLLFALCLYLPSRSDPLGIVACTNVQSGLTVFLTLLGKK